MRYFNSLPNLITTDNKGNLLALKNLLVRTSLLTKLQENPLLFYKYDLQEGDTPEIVANSITVIRIVIGWCYMVILISLTHNLIGHYQQINFNHI